MDYGWRFKVSFKQLVKSKTCLGALISFVIMGVSNLFFAQQPSRGGEKLLESGVPANIQPRTPPHEIKVVSYNIRWRSGYELEQIIRWLKGTKDSTAPVIVALQEVDRAKLRSGKIDHAKAIADSLGMYYVWTAPSSPTVNKKQAEEETGVVLLS